MEATANNRGIPLNLNGENPQLPSLLMDFAEEQMKLSESPIWKELREVAISRQKGDIADFPFEEEVGSLRQLFKLENFKDIIKHLPPRETFVSDEKIVRFIHRTFTEAAEIILRDGFPFGADLEGRASRQSEGYFSALWAYVRPHQQFDYILRGVAVVLEAPQQRYSEARRRRHIWGKGDRKEADFEVVGVRGETSQGFIVPVSRILGYIDRPTGKFIKNENYTPWF